jgi:hypothetical protein
MIDDSVPVELKILAGQNLTDLNIKLTPPAVISGRVRDDDGDPWIHASVGVFRSIWKGDKRQLEGFNSAEVNDAGEFRVEHLPPGRYYVSASPDAHWEKSNRVPPASQLQTTWYPSSLDDSSATPVLLLPGQEFTGADIRLRRSSVYRIRGKVSGLQGVPVLPGPSQWTKPRLALSSTSGVGGNSKGGLLKPDGSFEVEGLAPGTWQIRVEQGGIANFMALAVGTVQIDHDVEGLSLTVHAPHLLKGVVRIDGTDEALPAGLWLSLESLDGLFWDRTTMSHQDGSFDFENIPSGRYWVHTGRGTSGRYYVKQVRYGSELSETEFSISADGDVLDVTLSARGALVSGVVRGDGANGSALPLPQVVLLPDTADAELRRYDTHLGIFDQSGAFTVKEPVRPGEYILYALQGVPDGAWTDPEFIR